MSLRPTIPNDVPNATARIARAAFPHGSLLLGLRAELGPFFDVERFAALFRRLGQPAEAPWRLALVTLLQFAERLSDRQAADAVRSRIDWRLYRESSRGRRYDGLTSWKQHGCPRPSGAPASSCSPS